MEIYQDIPRLYTAVAEWLSCLIFVLILKRRWNRGLTILICLTALFIQSVFLVVTADAPLYLWLIVMLGAVFFMYFFLIAVINATSIETIYCCAVAFINAEFVASLEWQIHSFFGRGINTYIWDIFFLIGTYGVMFFAIYKMYSRMCLKEYLTQISSKEAVATVGIAAVSFLLSNLSYVNINSPFSGKNQTDIFLIRTLVDLCGIMIINVYQSRIKELIAARERDTIQSIYQKQYDQYRYYQESMEMVHIKYHDLKHQIVGLRAENSPEKRKEWLDMLEEELNEHKLIHETGNKVFDTIFAAKVFRAQKAKIRITCVADGKLLDFLSVTDICTVFGNALDNAIESVITINEPEKRLIHVSVSEQKGFVLIQISNYIEHDIIIEAGELPKTSKNDKQAHGYGLKSIRQCVRKYQGTMDIQVEMNWFELRIFIPQKRPFRTEI